MLESDTSKILWTASVAYPTSLKKRVLALQDSGSRHTIQTIEILQRDLSIWYGTALKQIIMAQGKSKPDVIANHGQTVFHSPHEGISVQLGDPSWIAAETGITVISHFRQGDLVDGGQGAPLIPAFHAYLAEKLKIKANGIAFLNIGGVANFTSISSAGSSVTAMDTGPGNMWIDQAMEEISGGKLHFDKGGKTASKGQVDAKGLRKLFEHPYFLRSYPKSTGRDDFPYAVFKKSTRAQGADLVATATAFTIESIALGLEQEVTDHNIPLQKIFVFGGGCKNLSLMAGLAERLDLISIHSVDELGIDPQFMEAMAFAYFGLRTLRGQGVGGPWTGNLNPKHGGRITPGENWIPLLAKLSLST